MWSYLWTRPWRNSGRSCSKSNTERPYGPSSLKCRCCNYDLLCRGPEAETVEKLRYADNGYEVKQAWNTDDPGILAAA